MFRIGLGQDSHFFDNKKKTLVLAGVKISESGGLEGNSDGDVVLHSLANALSSALGGDSLGTWADEMCLKQGIKDSHQYLERIFNKVKEKNYQVNNVSISIEAKKPYLKLKILKQMKKILAEILKINLEKIGITLTSGKNLTAFGKGKGIQALSIISLVKND